MKFSLSALALLTLVAVIPPTAAVAQAQKPTPSKAPASPSAPPASASAAAPAQPPVKIRRTEIDVVDNWTVTCTETDQPNAVRHCSADLKIMETENNVQRIVFTWVIGSQNGKLLSVLSMPSGVLIEPGVQISFGGKEVKKVGYSLCQPDHCEAVIPMDESIVKVLSAAETTDVQVSAINGNDVKFSVNMKGFAQALAAVSKS